MERREKMKKIMFNDKYGLTKAVLEGRKTMTRRIVSFKDIKPVKAITSPLKCSNLGIKALRPKYKFGEVLAIAQSYDCVSVYKCNHDFLIAKGVMSPTHHYLNWGLVDSAGFNNKMFVKAELMPHHIKITNIRVERLQEISDEDCLREGIYFDKEGGQSIGYPLAVPFYYTFRGAINRGGKQLYWSTPKDAFAALIDKVSGRGTWDSNPFVFVYEFELID